MIIRCRKCETRFRFEDNLIIGEGVWVRCSRCRHVFFQENPAQEEQQEILTEAVGARHAVPLLPEAAAKEEEIISYVAESRDEGLVKEIQADLPEEKDLDIAIKEFDSSEDLTEGKEEQPAGEAPGQVEEGVRKKGILWRSFAYLSLFILIVLLLAGGYFWAFPEDGQQAIRFLSDRFPAIEKIARDYGYQDDILHHVTFQNVEQHFVNNLLMGDLRILEGTAVNRANYSLTRIQVRGKLYDAGGMMIGEKLSFCGNLLTDAELASLTEEEIQKKLSQPLGSNISNERVKPGGQIPFMIVLPNQPAAARTTVMAAGAERLLE